MRECGAKAPPLFASPKNGVTLLEQADGERDSGQSGNVRGNIANTKR
jgi:hypothetical protein